VDKLEGVGGRRNEGTRWRARWEPGGGKKAEGDDERERARRTAKLQVVGRGVGAVGVGR